MTALIRRMTVAYATGVEHGYGGHYFAGEARPMIRITNRFLFQSGFKVGDKIEVIYEPGFITIKKLDK